MFLFDEPIYYQPSSYYNRRGTSGLNNKPIHRESPQPEYLSLNDLLHAYSQQQQHQQQYQQQQKKRQPSRYYYDNIYQDEDEYMEENDDDIDDEDYYYDDQASYYQNLRNHQILEQQKRQRQQQQQQLEQQRQQQIMLERQRQQRLQQLEQQRQQQILLEKKKKEQELEQQQQYFYSQRQEELKQKLLRMKQRQEQLNQQQEKKQQDLEQQRQEQLKQQQKYFFSQRQEQLKKQQEQQKKWSPKFDIKDIDGSVIIKAELPGFRKEDISLTIKDLTLSISGTKSNNDPIPSKEDSAYFEEIEDQEIDFINSTSSPVPSKNQFENSSKKLRESLIIPKQNDSFHQSFELSSNLDLQTVSAKHVDGVLTIQIDRKKITPKSFNIKVF